MPQWSMRRSLILGAVPVVSLGTVVVLSGVTPVSAHMVGQPAFHNNGPVSYPGMLQSVSAASATDVWAVGFHDVDEVSSTLIEHWNGRFWSLVESPRLGGQGGSQLDGVSALSASDAWAVGNYYTGSE